MIHERILVTGCAGFIGRHVVERLLSEGFAVSGVDDFSTGSRDTIASYGERVDFIEGDIADAKIAAAVVDGVDRIIHLAAVPSVPRSVDNPLESAQASVIGTVTLLDAARRAGVKRLVQASSSSVYGENPVIPRDEKAMPDPLSPYAAAKLAQEQYARVFTRCYGLDTASLRYFNVFGPGQNPESKYAAVIPKFITMMLRDETPLIYGDGTQTRDFTYVANVVDANLAAVLAPAPLRGESFNIGGGASHSLLDLVAALNAILGKNAVPGFLPQRTGDIKDSLADIGKAGECFGYRPKIDFFEGLRRTAASFLDGGKREGG